MDEWNATPPAHGVFFECLRIALYAAQRRLVAEKATHQFHRAGFDLSNVHNGSKAASPPLGSNE
jgi:hypothetical protein